METNGHAEQELEVRILAVIYEREGWWIAVCLPTGLATQARRREDIGPELQRLLRVQIRASLKHGLEPFTSLPAAPARYWRMYENRNGAVPERFQLPEGFEVEAYEVTTLRAAIA